MSNQIRDWADGDDLSADHLNEPLDAVRAVQSLFGANGVSVEHTPNGTVIGFDHDPRLNLISFSAQIVSAGPTGQSDTTNAMYWVQRTFPLGDPDPNVDFNFEIETAPAGTVDGNTAGKAYPVVFPALHLGEYTSDTHTLPTDGSIQVQVFGQIDTGAPAGDGTMIYRTRYWFTTAALTVRAKITSNATGSGLYNAKSVKGGATGVNPATALNLPDTGENVTSTEDLLFENAAESGFTLSHFLPLNAFVTGLMVGVTNEATPRPVIRAFVGPVVGVDFVVNLTKTSGTVGTKTTASTWVYTAKDLSNATTFGTGLSPQISRPNGALPFATLGKGYYDSSGTFHLLVALEVYGTGGC